ncbi:MAG: glutathione S-transferase [Ancylobacter novellus]|uniref:Glutathione S-transferase n=1 Tax=Ancylobacter novellus TaxID=921 RepID=A0A2W5MQ70_ANCNO|nr:MAG: glutathione S-transferase [Ancylobacter novellus]
MPVDQNAAVEITAFRWVPDLAKGLVRDLRVRWALEEAGVAYRERLLDAREARPEGYLREQPFGQVPTYEDAEARMFESAAIALHVAEGCDALLPRDAAARARAKSWALAAVNSVEIAINPLLDCDLFHAGEAWAKARRPEAERFLRGRLAHLSDWLGGRDFLEERFTVADLLMTTVLRELRHTDLVAERENLAAYVARCEARPAFAQSLADHMAAFEQPRRAA